MREHHRGSNSFKCLLSAMFGSGLVSCGIAHAQTLEVSVRVESPTSGEVGCTLYASEAGFPMDASKGRAQQWHPASDSVSCRFESLPAGTYAVTVSHDLNGNKIVDTNVVGMPKEAWGVSRNARPTLRAPKFAEAAFELDTDAITRISIEAKK